MTSQPSFQEPRSSVTEPLWPILLVLAEIAERLSLEQAQEASATTVAESNTTTPRKPGKRQAPGAAGRRDASRARRSLG